MYQKFLGLRQERSYGDRLSLSSSGNPYCFEAVIGFIVP